ncbi:peptidase U62 modulator of DNA gyrase [Thiorhodococcus drewsii AZ1]|uniref:Peptidase U62 modulator of DNA gyrase n=1 Tax=Thiorhodococcus drewsii AZ1 TaxID=765913 RepID=G2E206_9GAMM|nr:metalloprotease PmbA [Thiorhodococcus drewsii]EGV30955.1 peptidase U62 modulator of DNA gyrase [Thiorhodococcus drewsii AZ1]
MPILTTEDTAERLTRLQEIIEDMLKEAKRQGASDAEASVGSSAGLEVAVRLGEVETVEHTRDNGLSVTVYFGHSKGSASTSDLSPGAIRDAVSAACAIAAHTQEDRCAHLAEAELMATEVPDLDLYHPWSIGVDEAIELAVSCEDAARAYDTRIVNSEGASLSTHFGIHIAGNSRGFIGGYPTTRHGLNCAVIGQDGDAMQRDFWWTTARCAADLDTARSVGERAAARTVARLGGRRLDTREAPVMFRAEVATGLLRSLLGAISGSSIYRRSSFLLDRLGERIFPEFVRIHEEPHLRRGLSSAPFDGDGVATRAKDLVRDGILQTYVLDTYSGCRLGMPTTGNAGGVRNLRIEMGELDRAGMLREMGTGLLVTELMGHGVNNVTGDYSRGASGFWVENGEIQYPVEEITIAGNLKDMFAGLVAVGNDCDFPGGTRTGSWLIDRMTIAGE